MALFILLSGPAGAGVVSTNLRDRFIRDMKHVRSTYYLFLITCHG